MSELQDLIEETDALERRERMGAIGVFVIVGLLLVAAILVAGCASPAEDYVRADAATWAEFDRVGIDAWIDASKSGAELKDALHQLNVARRARIAHAIAAIGSAGK